MATNRNPDAMAKAISPEEALRLLGGVLPSSLKEVPSSAAAPPPTTLRKRRRLDDGEDARREEAKRAKAAADEAAAAAAAEEEAKRLRERDDEEGKTEIGKVKMALRKTATGFVGSDEAELCFLPAPRVTRYLMHEIAESLGLTAISYNTHPHHDDLKTLVMYKTAPPPEQVERLMRRLAVDHRIFVPKQTLPLMAQLQKDFLAAEAAKAEIDKEALEELQKPTPIDYLEQKVELVKGAANEEVPIPKHPRDLRTLEEIRMDAGIPSGQAGIGRDIRLPPSAAHTPRVPPESSPDRPPHSETTTTTTSSSSSCCSSSSSATSVTASHSDQQPNNNNSSNGGSAHGSSGGGGEGGSGGGRTNEFALVFGSDANEPSDSESYSDPELYPVYEGGGDGRVTRLTEWDGEESDGERRVNEDDDDGDFENDGSGPDD